MKKMTKWLAVCAVCVMGSVPAMAAEVPDVTVTPIPIETPAPDVTPIETPAPTPIPEVKNGWYEYETLQRAKDVVSKITKPSMSKSEKFETCFRWVMYQHYYDTRRIFYNQTAWPALYANDYLILSGKGGDCFSDACSFAYLAKALGYKNVYVCVDTTATDGSGHCWAEIGGRVYDPLFAEAKSYYGYFGVGYGSYGLYPERRVAV